MSRREYWKEKPWRLGVIHRHETDGDPLQDAWRERVENPKRPRAGDDGFSTGYLTRISKEVIYLRDEDHESCPTLMYVTWGLDLGSAELTLDANWLVVEPTRDELLTGLGLALAYEVPVVPDTEDLVAELAALEREVLSRGFLLSKGDGDQSRVISSRYARVDLDSLEALDVLGRPEPVMPSEVRVVVATARQELRRHAEAARLLAALRLATQELSDALATEAANEAELQRCLTRHPILFGPEYRQLVAEFRLGGDYRMDFALVRSSGLADLVEIESSTHKLYNKRGDPSAALVHAEQQVMNWLAWIERFGELARRELPELERPVGYVVIGRDTGWTEDEHRRLQQRNLVLGGAVQVLTWDGLRRRSTTLLRHLEGLATTEAIDA